MFELLFTIFKNKLNCINMRKILLFALTLILAQSLVAQNLYSSREYSKAIDKKTRNHNGKPGENYWQNKSTYKINVKIDPTLAKIDAFQTITYINNSPDTLKYVCLNVLQNLYKKGAKRSINVEASDLHDGVQIDNIMVNNKLIKPKSIRIEGTLLYIMLRNNIMPGTTTTFKMDWKMNIPEKSFVRMAKYSDKALFVGKWFPKLAVYDDIEGWNKYQHNGMAEFYNDYSDYDVSIEVPANYIVQATGELQNAEKILHPQILIRLNEAKTSDKNVTIVSSRDRIVTKNGKQRWRFTASEVPDFAFGIAKGYIWEASSIKLLYKKDRVFVDAMYPKKAKDYKEVIDIAKATLSYMSNKMPRITYPYSHISIYNGHGGMEYPMIVNNGNSEDRAKSVYLNSHEIMHTIFPVMVGMSETKYAWFDEGFTVVMPEELQDKMEPNANPAIKTVEVFEKRYANSEREPVMMTPSHYLHSNEYFSMNYCKSEIAIRLFKDYLGKKAFASLMNSFVNTWKSKHPTPYDFFAFTNSYMRTNLNWFWQKWFFEYAKPDLGIRSVTREANSYSIVIENIGGLPLPLDIKIEYADGTTKNIKHKLSVWKTGEKALSINHFSDKQIKEISLESKLIPDINRKNNSFIL